MGRVIKQDHEKVPLINLRSGVRRVALMQKKSLTRAIFLHFYLHISKYFTNFAPES